LYIFFYNILSMITNFLYVFICIRCVRGSFNKFNVINKENSFSTSCMSTRECDYLFYEVETSILYYYKISHSLSLSLYIYIYIYIYIYVYTYMYIYTYYSLTLSLVLIYSPSPSMSLHILLFNLFRGEFARAPKLILRSFLLLQQYFLFFPGPPLLSFVLLSSIFSHFYQLYHNLQLFLGKKYFDIENCLGQNIFMLRKFLSSS
jgi:hypothetical protein